MTKASNENLYFSDPRGVFKMSLPASWKYRKDDGSVKRGLFQFEISDSCVFQLSCKLIDEGISTIIKANKIIAHDFNLPNVSFHENYEESDSMRSYIWMAVLDDHFFMAVYYYDFDKKPQKDIGLDLMDVRMCLRHIHYNRNKDNLIKDVVSTKTPNQEKDYLDIASWRNQSSKFLRFMSKSDKSQVKRVTPLDIDVVKLYALLKSQISLKPNGFYDLVRVGMPLDAMFWWDFVLESDRGFIQIWRTPYLLEAIYDFDGPFDLNSFLNSNIEKYSHEIDEVVKNFERHTIYINHYKSYDECVKTLWKEISRLDLSYPKSSNQHIADRPEIDAFYSQFKVFASNSIKYHALAKSLVLNAAFKVESFLNLVIRIGSLPELKLYPDVLSKFLRQDFSHKVKNLMFYSQILIDDFNRESNLYRDVKELMTLRNKYVHFDEDATHNRLGEIFYDDNYPLHPMDSNRPAVESVKQTFHKPELEVVRKAMETADEFVKGLEALFLPELKDKLQFVMNQNTIGHNADTGAYSSVYAPISVDFFNLDEKKQQEETE